jgi:hypothetical protein
MNEYKHILPHSKPHHNQNIISTSIFLNNLSRNKKRNILPSQIHSKDQPGSKFKHLLPITILIRKAMRSITFGSVSTSAPKMKKTRRLPSLNVTLSWMSGTRLPICLIKRVQLTTVYFLQEDAVQME